MAESASVLSTLASAGAADFALLAALHDREPSAEMLSALRQGNARQWLAFKLEPEITDALDAALAQLPDPLTQEALDALAADYADIYLVTTYEAAPSESYWLDDENLICQQAMFDVRDWMARYDLRAQNWRQRSEDHLVSELLFLSHLCEVGTEETLRDTARFLDHHLLLWIDAFAERIAQRAREPWFKALGNATAAHALAVRTLLEQVIDEPRWFPPEPGENRETEMVMKYIPGVAPSW